MPNPYPVLYRIGMTPWEHNTDEGPLPGLLANRVPGRALDGGCGTGRHAVQLAEAGWTVVGVDAVTKPVRAARAHALTAGVQDRVTFVKGDVTRLDLATEGAFDLVLDIGCIHGLTDTQQHAFADWVTGHTGDGAVVVIHAATPRTGLGPKGLDESAVKALFPAPWSLVAATDSPTAGGGPLRGATFRWYHLQR